MSPNFTLKPLFKYPRFQPCSFPFIWKCFYTVFFSQKEVVMKVYVTSDCEMEDFDKHIWNLKKFEIENPTISLY